MLASFVNNSKYVKAKIIQAKIDTVKMIISSYDLLHRDVEDLKLHIHRLELQLKHLENE
jgi:polyhydroxyalkanoate synthesis regulator phasin